MSQLHVFASGVVRTHTTLKQKMAEAKGSLACLLFFFERKQVSPLRCESLYDLTIYRLCHAVVPAALERFALSMIH